MNWKIAAIAIIILGPGLITILNYQQPIKTLSGSDVIIEAQKNICLNGDLFLSDFPLDSSFGAYRKLVQCSDFFSITESGTDSYVMRFYDQNGKQIGHLTGGLGGGECELFWKKCSYKELVSQCVDTIDVCANIKLDCPISSYLTDQCHYVNAQRLAKASECGKVKNAQLQAGCITDLAVQNKDFALCSQIRNDQFQKECIRYAAIQIAKSAEDTNDCLAIDKIAVDECLREYARIASIAKNWQAELETCSLITDDALRENCYPIRFFTDKEQYGSGEFIRVTIENLKQETKLTFDTDPETRHPFRIVKTRDASGKNTYKATSRTDNQQVVILPGEKLEFLLDSNRGLLSEKGQFHLEGTFNRAGITSFGLISNKFEIR